MIVVVQCITAVVPVTRDDWLVSVRTPVFKAYGVGSQVLFGMAHCNSDHCSTCTCHVILNCTRMQHVQSTAHHHQMPSRGLGPPLRGSAGPMYRSYPAHQPHAVLPWVAHGVVACIKVQRSYQAIALCAALFADVKGGACTAGLVEEKVLTARYVPPRTSVRSVPRPSHRLHSTTPCPAPVCT